MYENLCMNCMKDIGELPQCPHCRTHKNSNQLPPFLPHRAIIANRYLIGNVLEANGDGVTYIAFDMERKATVTVREFLPDTIVKRTMNSPELDVKPGMEDMFNSCKNEFLDLWRKLARMRGLSALILVIDIVEENNTAYAISEHMEGTVTLRDYLLSSKTGYMSWEEARIMFMPVLSTISTLHSAGIIHRGISPNTLLVGPDRKIRISGFSIPECRNVNTGIAAEIFAGYAPVEQFGVDAPSGPWTDIYAFAAVLYRALIGSTPIDSVVRMNSDRMMIPAKFAEAIPAYVINALINALQIMPKDRTKTIEQFRAELSASPTDALAADFEAEQRRSQKRRPAPSRKPVNNQRANKNTPKKSPAKKTTTKNSGKKGSSPLKSESDVQMAVKAGLIAAAVLLLIFIILCFTVLRGHIGVDGKTDTTTVSPQSEMVKVPKFVDRTYTSIKSQPEYTANFKIEVKEEYSTEVKKGYVISQSLTEGKEVPKGSTVELVVSLGIEQIIMIDVTGKTYDEAVQELEKLGFKCEKLDKENTGDKTSGTVAAQTIAEGTECDKGTLVRLQVWTDPESTTAAQ
ncbi:MAG: PASTA domain-containing protein [Oscillospiraceae bacterium]|nr:PASTA domain-containing protein [Oscillospiraceae bacterium]